MNETDSGGSATRRVEAVNEVSDVAAPTAGESQFVGLLGGGAGLPGGGRGGT